MYALSEASFDDAEQWRTRVERAAQEDSRQLAPKGQVDSTDIVRECGGQFVSTDRKDSYPHDIAIDTSEDENSKRCSAPLLVSSSRHSPSRGKSTSLTTSAAVSAPAHLASKGPYLSKAEFLRLPLRREPRGRHTRSSGPGSDSSDEFRSAWGCQNSAPTTYDGDDGNGAGEDGGHGRESTPSFTRNNTPPPPSEATTEDQGEAPEIRAPDPPFPFSNYHTYDAGYGMSVVKTYEQSHEHHE